MGTTYYLVKVLDEAKAPVTVAEYFDDRAAWRHVEEALFRGNDVTVRMARVSDSMLDDVLGPRRRSRHRAPPAERTEEESGSRRKSKSS